MSFLALAKKMISSPIWNPRYIRLFSSPSTPNPHLKTPPFIVNDYLVSTFGIAPATAARISKPISYLKSPNNPDAVRCFLRAQGFSDAEIKTMVTQRPNIICSSPENTLAPNLRALREMNLSTSALNQIILSDPVALQLNSAVPRINFWKDFVLGHETDLIKLFKRNRGLIGLDTAGGIATKISLLQSYGISIADIQRIVCTVQLFITCCVSKMDDMLKRAKELGFQPQSRMFVHGLAAVLSCSREMLQKKMELLKSFGWSEEEFLSAVQKYPAMLHITEENLQTKLEFLLGEARCHISYITVRPMLLLYSLEKRLRPRHHVLRLLESKGLTGNRKHLSSVMQFNESKFVEIYIVPHKEKIPELHEVYRAACSSVSGSISHLEI